MVVNVKNRKVSQLDQPVTLKILIGALNQLYDDKIGPKLQEHDKRFDEIYGHVDGLYKQLEDISRRIGKKASRIGLLAPS